MDTIETDYLVVGTGGTAMAFVDTLLSERPDARITMVDRHHRPGGHWNDAYPFVRLHQPSAWYGVGSRELSEGALEAGGLNDGMLALASGAEVMAHFEQVMKQRFLPSGRVRWLPRTDWLGGDGGTHRVRSIMTGSETQVKVSRKLVNATHAKTEVPSTRPPQYLVQPGVACIPLNALPTVSRPHAGYTVVGSGKTGMDACIWLLENGVPHDRIRWVVPRDAWFMDRANVQPGPAGWRKYFDNMLAQFDAIAEAGDLPDLFRRLEASGALHRLDPSIEPTTYRCALVSRGEAAQLRKIRDIVRLGRVRAIEPTRLVLERGDLPAVPDTLYIDCTACGIQPIPDSPVFDGDAIHLLMLRVCQPLFSASLIAWVEAHVADPQDANAMCRPVPGPELPLDWLRMWGPTLANVARWRQDPALSAWLATNRLNGQAVVLKGVAMDAEVEQLLKQVAVRASQAGARIAPLLATAGAA